MTEPSRAGAEPESWGYKQTTLAPGPPRAHRERANVLNPTKLQKTQAPELNKVQT